MGQSDFPFEAVMDVVRECRNDDRASHGRGHRAVVREIVDRVAGQYGVDPKTLAMVTAKMMDGEKVSEDWFETEETRPSPAFG